jgi:hypothetical protein
MPEVRYVRKKPYDPKSGHTNRQYSVRFGGRFHKFNQVGIWIKVPKALADVLEDARHDAQNPNSPLIFEVYTKEEAEIIDRADKVRREKAKALVEPSVETAVDMVGSTEQGRGDLALEEVTHMGSSSSRVSALEEVGSELPAEQEKPAKKKPAKKRKPAKKKTATRSKKAPKKK